MCIRLSVEERILLVPFSNKSSFTKTYILLKMPLSACILIGIKYVECTVPLNAIS